LEEMNSKYLFVMIAILALVPTTIFVSATNESSYQYGYMKGYLTLDPQNSPTANWYPELKNDTCAPSPSYKSGNIVIPAVTNTTACEHGYFQGWKDWCSDIKHAVGCIGNITLGDFPDTLLRAHQQYIVGAKAASNVSSPICPMGENAAYCLGWANNNTFDDEGCADSPTANITRWLPGCIGDNIPANQIGALPILVGNWHFVNETEDGTKAITGTLLFNNNGYMKMTVHNKSGLGDYVLEESWAYIGTKHHILTICNGYGCQNSTLTTITPNHIESVDSNNDTVHLMRFHPSPSSLSADIAAAHPEESGMTDNITVLYQDGQNRADLQNYTGALSLYQKALAIDPNNVKVLADMGRVLYNLHNYTGAISAVDKALTIEPRHAYALESKGFLLYELGDYKQALGYINKALELNVSYQTLNIKGLDLTKLGDYGQAISAFNTAIAVNPDDDSLYYNKALTLTDLALHDHNRDDINLALQNVDKAIDMNVYDKNAESLKLSLGQLLFWAQHD
jgi:Flp pilus assembly protein TadD